MIIPLTQNNVAIIDDIDSDLADLIWHSHKMPSSQTTRYYADRHGPWNKGKRATVRMHRVVLERKLGRTLAKSESVDHINHNGLDNRRENLRLATDQQNQFNQRRHIESKTSQYRGVSWNTRSSKWIAQIGFRRQRIHLGRFNSEIDAARAYDKKARELCPTFCNININE